MIGIKFVLNDLDFIFRSEPGKIKKEQAYLFLQLNYKSYNGANAPQDEVKRPLKGWPSA